MDKLKKDTVKDYTAWDLNCPRYVKVKHRQKLEAIFKRKARRKNKQKLKRYKGENKMKVITIREDCHGFIGIADTKEHAIDFLIDKNWLSENTGLPYFDGKDKEWKERSVKEKLGENWENILKDSDIEQINDQLDDAFLLYEEHVYTGEE